MHPLSRPRFPVDGHLPRIRELLLQNNNLVISASPGAGKTTIIPLALLNEPWMSGAFADRRIIMLQPRRLAARMAAERMAALHGDEVGQTVGYQVRFERRLSRQTRIEILTEGLLTRRMQIDPFLEGVSMVIFDEFHERSIHADLGLAMAREIQQAVRPDLRLMVMSATLDTAPIARFLDPGNVIEVPGFLHPVAVSWLNQSSALPLPQLVAKTIRQCLENQLHESILVFLPGESEIYRTLNLLEQSSIDKNILLLPLHGTLPLDKQRLILQPQKRRRVILATNIAETSLTIEGITTVIDSGWRRNLRYDPASGLERLELERTSRASADQRAGRAGRLGPGQAIRLWSEQEHATRPTFSPPSIQTADLSETLLELAVWGKPDPAAFPWFEAPPARSLELASSLLQKLGATNPDHTPSPLGRRMASLPLHPRISRLLLEAEKRGMISLGCDLAAILSERPIAQRNRERSGGGFSGDSDLFSSLDLLERARTLNFQGDSGREGIDLRAASRIDRISRQLAEILAKQDASPNPKTSIPQGQESKGQRRSIRGEHTLQKRSIPGTFRVLAIPGGHTLVSDTRPENTNEILKVILAGFPDRVARRRMYQNATAEKPGSAFLLVGGKGLSLDPASLLRQADFIVALSIDGVERLETRTGLIRQASFIDPAWLAELFPHAVREVRQVQFDEGRQGVSVRLRRLYYDLGLFDQIVSPLPGDAPSIENLLSQEAARNLRDAFHFSLEADQCLLRVQLLKALFSNQDWPAFDEPWFAAHLPELVRGCRSFEDIRKKISVLFLNHPCLSGNSRT